MNCAADFLLLRTNAEPCGRIRKMVRDARIATLRPVAPNDRDRLIVYECSDGERAEALLSEINRRRLDI
jgi:hypothetical protein